MFKKFFIALLSIVCVISSLCFFANDKKEVNAFTANDVVYYGNDISVWQGNTNFSTMKNSSDFVILRIGYSTSLDTRFLEYMEGALSVGLPVGVYIYSLAESTTDAINEANWIIDTLETNGYDKGSLSFPIFFDYEQNSVIQNKSNTENTAIVNAFANTMWDAGYYPGVYMGGYNFTTHMNLDDLNCDAWIAAYFANNQAFSSFTSKYGYHKSVTMWQFAADPQYGGQLKTGAQCGVSSATLDEDYCFVDYPSIIKDGGYNGFASASLTVKSNAVVGNTESNSSHSGWDLTSAYNTSNSNFNNRKAVLTSLSGDNLLYFNQSKSENIKVGATLKATSKLTNELFGKFGIGFFTKSGKGLWVYVDAEGTSGTSLSSITGKNVAVVGKNSSISDGWDWKTSTNVDIATNVYSSTSSITIEIDRQGARFDVYINGAFVKTLYGLNYDIEPTEQIYPCIQSFGTYIEVTNYYSTPTHNSLTIDGDLSDWQNLAIWNSINDNKKEIYDSTNPTKGATFYHRWTREGLFIYAISKHSKDSTGQANWWENTNFEIIINQDDSASQYYATSSEARGLDSFYFKTSGSNGNYTTVLEAFIKDCNLFKKGINIGFAFKVRAYINTSISDYITPAGGTQTDYWWAENLNPHNLPFTLTQEYLKDQTSEYEMAGTTGLAKDGNTIVLKDFSGVRDLYFSEFEDSFTNTFASTFNVTGSNETETDRLIGLSYIDEWGDGFYFYANSSDNTFGLVRVEKYVYKYSETSTAVSAFSNQSWANGTPFTLKIDRNNTVFDLYINDTKVHTISDSTVYKLLDKQSIYPSIRSWNTYAQITDYGLVYNPINDITINGDLSDWKALSNWEDIQDNAIKVIDDTNPNKGVWLYTRLTENGLLVAVEAHHDKDSSEYWGDNWWMNTNMQFYIGLSSYENRIYVTEFLNTGFTLANFATYPQASGYTTIFEGYLNIVDLAHLGAYNGESLRIGLGFRVNNGSITDTITVNGTQQTFWFADNMHPLLINNVIYPEEIQEVVTPPSGDNPQDTPTSSQSSSTSSTSSTSSINSSSSSAHSIVSSTSSSSLHSFITTSSTSKQNSSSISSSSSLVISSSSASSSSCVISSSSSSQTTINSTSKAQSSISSSTEILTSVSSSSETQTSISSTESSTSLENSSNVNDSTSSEDGESTSGGCSSSIYDLSILLPLAFITFVALVKKSKKQK